MRQGNINYSQKTFGCSMMLHTLCCGAVLCPFSLCPVLLFCPAAFICICKECLQDTLVGDESELLVRLWEIANGQNYCHRLSSVRSVWISFLPVTEMTRFPLIKGQCCQKPDRNFPAMQCSRITQRSRCVGLSWMEPWTGTIKSDICFCDGVFNNLLNKMSRVYMYVGGKKITRSAF